MKTDVVLLPGLHGTTALFDGFIALAPPWARCRAIALPTDCEQSFDAIADAIEPQLRTLEAFVLFAESFSAPIAARVAHRLGARIALLVLCSPLIESPLAIAPTIAASVVHRWAPVWATAFAMTGGDRTLAASLLREARKLPRHVLAARFASVAGADRETLLTFLQAPLLAIGSSHDRLTSARLAQEVVAAVPFAIYTEVAAPHLVAQMAPANVWAAITEEFETAA